MSKQAKKNPTAAHFESSMKELEQIVLKLESGELELEESLALFETGMQHSQACKQALEKAAWARASRAFIETLAERAQITGASLAPI